MDPQSNTTIPILDGNCPIDSRRTSTELWIKLAVVHFTTSTAFFRLTILQNEPLLSWKTLFFIVSPPVLIIQYAAALLLILTSWIYLSLTDIISLHFLHERPAEHNELVLRCLKWLFGRLPVLSKGEYDSLPDGTNGNDNSDNFNINSVRTSRRTHREKIAKHLGRIFLCLAFLAQCSGTLAIYFRRASHSALTRADQRLFELGCSGLFTGLLTLLIELRLPVLTSPVPRIDPSASNSFTSLERAVMFLRGTNKKYLHYIPQSDRWISRHERQYLAFFAPAFLFYLKVVISLRSSFGRLIAGTYGFNKVPREEREAPFEILKDGDLVLTSFCLYAGFMFLVGVANLLSRYVDDEIACKIMLLILSSFVAPCLFFTIRQAWEEVRKLEGWPADKGCEKRLWVDPKGNWIWWLA